MNLHKRRPALKELQQYAVCVSGYLYPGAGLCYNPSIENKTNPLANSGWERSARDHSVTESQPIASLNAAYEHQDSQFHVAFSILEQAIAERAFPGASVAIVFRNTLRALKAFGNFTYENDSPAVTTESIFDLASVSKVVATTTMAMILYERGILDLEMPVAAVVPEFTASESRNKPHTEDPSSDDPRRKLVTLRMLLAHTSGLVAYEKLFLEAKTREELLALCFKSPLLADPGAKAEYSDTGFMILGVALERLADEPLDRFCQREVFGRLGMACTMFTPPSTLRERIVPTSDDHYFRRRVIQGEVQDENASVLGGVAAHAGVFSTASDSAIFASALLNGGVPLVRPETLRLFTQRETSPAGTSRALGWDTPSIPSQSGKYFSARSFGHLGYTGTSLWLDLERQLSVILLTNRTWPDCSNHTIKLVRPEFHDAVVEVLERFDSR